MQFYKFEGISTAERRPGENDSRRIMCEKARRISKKTNTFNLLRLSEAYLFVMMLRGTWLLLVLS